MNGYSGSGKLFIHKIKEIASYPGLPMFFNVPHKNLPNFSRGTLKNMGKSGYEATMK